MLSNINYLKRKLKFHVKRFLGRKNSIIETAFAYVNPTYSILEAGAHIGVDTLKLAKLTTGKIYAFEPIPSLYQQLSLAIKDASNVDAFELALGNQSGEANFFVSSGESDASSSILQPIEHLKTNPKVKFDQQIIVKTSTLDDWAKTNNIQNVDFMWLDMQGYEYDMLSLSTVIFPTVRILFTEVSTIELYRGQMLYENFKQWLFDQGFKLIMEDLPWEFTGNALFIRDVKKIV